MKNNLMKILITSIVCLIMNPLSTYAHPGRTDKYGCHTCRTNCEKYGLNYNEYHCHNGNTNTNSSQTTTAKIKSSDNSIKNIMIGNENLPLSDKMTYKTKDEKLNININLNDKNANYEVNTNDLQVGDNNIEIKVTAENGDIKIYKLLVTREKLSNNTNLKVLINNKEVNFKEEINISSKILNLNYKYELEDKNATMEVTGDKNLQEGKNIVKFLVTAEDGTQKEYELVVNKESQSSDNSGIITSLTTITIIGGGAYYFIKKRKN